MTPEAMALAARMQAAYIEGPAVTEHYLGHMSEERWRKLATQLEELGEIEATPDIPPLFVNIAPAE
jgi:hypothetical protein